MFYITGHDCVQVVTHSKKKWQEQVTVTLQKIKAIPAVIDLLGDADFCLV
jgi:hypothetical protein